MDSDHFSFFFARKQVLKKLWRIKIQRDGWRKRKNNLTWNDRWIHDSLISVIYWPAKQMRQIMVLIPDIGYIIMIIMRKLLISTTVIWVPDDYYQFCFHFVRSMNLWIIRAHTQTKEKCFAFPFFGMIFG